MLRLPGLPDPDEPWALSSPLERERRQGLLSLPRVRPLADYVAALRASRRQLGLRADIPDFDPCDGGVAARALFVGQDPGKQAIASGFISRNNPDQTARNMLRLQADAGIARLDTALWNIVPWRVGTVREEDLAEAKPHLRDLLGLLPGLVVVVLVGRKAQSAATLVSRLSSARIVASPHMSPLNFNTDAEQRRLMVEAFAEVSALLRHQAV